VGSNGKSSTTRFAACALASAGLRVGAYLSPHVTGWHERLEIDGRPIRPQGFAQAVSAVREASDTLSEPVTQFEVLTAAAFVAFSQQALDAMVVEAGLGGRFDATNVFDGSALVALTRIDLEHTALLGDTVEQIAEEKLAVVRRGGGTLVTGHMDEVVRAVVDRRVAATGVTALRLGRDFRWTRGRGETITIETPRGRHIELVLAARGDFQRDNLSVGLAAAEELLDRPVPTEPLRARLAELAFAGRMEVFPGSPMMIADGAHNPAGARALAAGLRDLLAGRRAVLLTSVLKDKDLTGILAALVPGVEDVVATASSHPRAETPEAILRAVSMLGRSAHCEPGLEAALAAARRLAGPDGAVVIAGSLYLIEDLRRCSPLLNG